MNEVLRPFLRRFVLVFFDDILVYSSSWAEHLRHLHLVFTKLQEQNLVVKRSKCAFGERTVGYLGHVISKDGVAMDAAKVPRPRSVRDVRRFLGLAGYYRCFIKNYGAIAEPLTRLLRKGAFQWLDKATGAFHALQQALTTAPIMQLPDFDQPFVECDASGVGVGAVLHQGSGAIAYFSRQIAARHAHLAAYERELIGLVQAVRHWHAYLWGREFIVKTDHYSLKYLLDQCLTTIPQHQWISKLIGYDFRVQYKPGTSNTVVDALSRRDAGEDGQSAVVSAPVFAVFDELRAETATMASLQQMKEEVLAGRKGDEWQFVDGLITVCGKVYVAVDSPSLPEILTAAHGMGHEGIEKHCIAYAEISFFLGQQQQSRNMFRPASFANAIRSNTLSSRSAAAIGGAEHNMVPYSHGFCRRILPGKRQISNTYGGGSFLKLRSLCAIGSSLHDYFGS
jgi:hypothetical protein